jgi:hypothetical protein
MTPDSILKFKSYSYTKWVVALFSLAVALSLLAWSLLNYQPPPTIYGSRAIFSIIVLSLTLALLGRYLLLGVIKREAGVVHVPYQRLPSSWQALFLFDITAPIYLAAGVLVDVPAGVLTALITQTALQVFTCLRGFVALTEAAYRVAFTALVVLVADGLFTVIAGTQQSQAASHYSQLTESHELLGCILAAVVMLLLLTLVSLPAILRSRGNTGNSAARPGEHPSTPVPLWKVFVTSPALRYQALVLSVGPLLPVVDIFDNVVAEVAWLFFLVPLFAI